MSNIGKIPIEIPEGVNVEVVEGKIKVRGSKGELERPLYDKISISKENNILILKRKEEDREVRERHGLERTLISNMIKGVSEGFIKKLKMVGVGFKAQSEGSKLIINVGFSHPVGMEIPEGIDVKVEKNTEISVSGIDKELVGRIAANIRAVKKPEPYKGKGIMYEGEKIRRKAGKALKAGPSGA